MSARLPRPALALLLLATCIGCDRVTKRIAVDRLEPGERHSFLGDTVRFEYAENTGAFLGLGASLPEGTRFALLTVLTAILLLAVTWALVKRPLPGPRFIALTLILAGGLGNLIDRASTGFVVDFMNLGVGSLRTGIFNVADVAITVGVVVIIFAPTRTPEGASDRPPEAV